MSAPQLRSEADGHLHGARDAPAGLVGDSDAARFVTQNWDPSTLPEPLDPADLADVMWDLYLKRDRFDEIVGLPSA